MKNDCKSFDLIKKWKISSIDGKACSDAVNQYPSTNHVIKSREWSF